MCDACVTLARSRSLTLWYLCLFSAILNKSLDEKVSSLVLHTGKVEAVLLVQ